ncbi:SH3 domain-containing protein [Nitrosomonas sp. HPC101]|nr:SH3 domain-containing protein [Nitrosomonas sp. HPC101]
MGGCTSSWQKKSLIFGQPVNLQSADLEKIEIVPIPEKLPCYRLYRDEIVVLKQMIAERDELIRSLNARELDQAHALRETASEISRAQNKLYRLATQPEAASRIAEAEVAALALKQTELSESDAALQFLARRLLDAAMVAYEHKNYSSAMSYAAQSGEFIDAIINPARKNPGAQDAVILSFRTPVLLFVTQVGSLRTDPDSHSRVVGLLKKNTSLTATAYHGGWLHVQTEDNLSGWIQNLLVDIQISNRNSEK